MIGWLHCAAGVSGDMLLGALVDVGVPVEVLQEAVDAVTPEPVLLRAARVQRNGIAATRVHVTGTGSVTHRTWADVRALLEPPGGPGGPGREAAVATFSALAVAEAAVHGTTPDQVHFHEVGALDAIADVVGVCAGVAYLGLTALVVSPVALGAGTVRAAHGVLPVPGPAVVALLRGRPTHGGPVDVELTTPTGAALVATLATGWGSQPPMRVSAQGFGAGARTLPEHPNVLRLIVGDALGDPPGGAPADQPGDQPADRPGVPVGVPVPADLVLETNVDDLDPRLWPDVLAALLAAGADDAWLVPILMKKGRPAHTLRVLVPVQHLTEVQQIVFTQTSAIGLRHHPVRKVALDREVVTVTVDGQPVRVKLARSRGHVVNAQPEWQDVAALARRTGQPAKVVLARSAAAFWATGQSTTEGIECREH